MEESQRVKNRIIRNSQLLSDRSQITRASRSVTNNIAEGYGRFHFQENIQFCRQARGSLFELIDHLIISFDEKYINLEKFLKLKFKIYNIIKISEKTKRIKLKMTNLTNLANSTNSTNSTYSTHSTHSTNVK